MGPRAYWEEVLISEVAAAFANEFQWSHASYPDEGEELPALLELLKGRLQPISLP